MTTQPTLFDGATFDPKLDQARLTGQSQKVFALMQDGQWRTLGEIAASTGSPEASVSARLRDFRKRQFGGHAVERRRRGGEANGLWEYRVVVNTGGK